MRLSGYFLFLTILWVPFLLFTLSEAAPVHDEDAEFFDTGVAQNQVQTSGVDGGVATVDKSEGGFWKNYWYENLKPLLKLTYAKSKQKLKQFTIYLHRLLQESD